MNDGQREVGGYAPRWVGLSRNEFKLMTLLNKLVPECAKVSQQTNENTVEMRQMTSPLNLYTCTCSLQQTNPAKQMAGTSSGKSILCWGLLAVLLGHCNYAASNADIPHPSKFSCVSRQTANNAAVCSFVHTKRAMSINPKL